MFACVIASFMPVGLGNYTSNINGLNSVRNGETRSRQFLPGLGCRQGAFCLPWLAASLHHSLGYAGIGEAGLDLFWMARARKAAITATKPAMIKDSE